MIVKTCLPNVEVRLGNWRLVICDGLRAACFAHRTITMRQRNLGPQLRATGEL